MITYNGTSITHDNNLVLLMENYIKIIDMSNPEKEFKVTWPDIIKFIKDKETITNDH